MAEDAQDHRIEQEVREARFERLYGTVRLELRRGRIDSAATAAAELVKEWPESTTACELWGDVLLAQGDKDGALAQYEHAKELEPANADAERKYAALKLQAANVELRQKMMEAALADPTRAVRRKRTQPAMSAALALVFPGFGQFCNEDHVKGLGLFAGGFVLLVLLIGEMVLTPYTAAMKSHSGKHGVPVGQQIEQARDALTNIGAFGWTMIFLGVVAFIAIYVYGVWDAYEVARRRQAEEDELGIG